MEKEKAISSKEENPKSKLSVNRNFRKHNKLGFHRLTQRKKKISSKPAKVK